MREFPIITAAVIMVFIAGHITPTVHIPAQSYRGAQPQQHAAEREPFPCEIPEINVRASLLVELLAIIHVD